MTEAMTDAAASCIVRKIGFGMRAVIVFLAKLFMSLVTSSVGRMQAYHTYQARK